MARLRDPQTGCPWDVRQTFASIAPYTVEEAYEVAEAIAAGDLDALRDELGDLLLQVVFHAQMAAEHGAFDFADVAAAIAAKMIRRHPHVFAGVRYRDADEQRAAWEQIKRDERAGRGADPHADRSALAGVAAGLPAFVRALKLQRRAAAVGFDWDAAAPILDKIAEEQRELRDALDRRDGADDREDRIADELGDLLFACTNLARHLDIDPELALRRASHKFERRFRFIEAALRADGRTPQQAGLDEMEALWQQAKRDD